MQTQAVERNAPVTCLCRRQTDRLTAERQTGDRRDLHTANKVRQHTHTHFCWYNIITMEISRILTKPHINRRHTKHQTHVTDTQYCATEEIPKSQLQHIALKKILSIFLKLMSWLSFEHHIRRKSNVCSLTCNEHIWWLEKRPPVTPLPKKIKTQWKDFRIFRIGIRIQNVNWVLE